MTLYLRTVMSSIASFFFTSTYSFDLNVEPLDSSFVEGSQVVSITKADHDRLRDLEGHCQHWFSMQPGILNPRNLGCFWAVFGHFFCTILEIYINEEPMQKIGFPAFIFWSGGPLELSYLELV